MIRADERVAQVLSRDASLIEVFASASPAFERLRNPVLRRTMARLVTVEQAARIAGIEPSLLLQRLNSAIGAAVDGDTSGGHEPPAPETPTTETRIEMMTPATDLMPDALRSLPPHRIVDLDVRDDLRSGREPFSRIVAARRALQPGEVLRLRAIFEPVPLYQVMARQGLDHWTERLDDDDWRVWFFAGGPDLDSAAAEPTPCGGCQTQPPPASEAAPAAARNGQRQDELDGVVVLDVRGLEPPEPMIRTLAALEQLPEGGTLVQLNVRVPQFLLPQLEERGFTWEIHEQSNTLVRVLIRRR